MADAAGGRIGVLVMDYGTPSSLDDVARYYSHIRRGRPPSLDELDELRGRYQAIGGLSPLARHTEAQRAVLAMALDQRASGRCLVAVGHKHARPFIEDGVAALADAGIREVVGVVLAPHYSRASVGDYHARAEAAAKERDVRYAPVNQWHLLPGYVEVMGRAVRGALIQLGTDPAATHVVFTAHSLPERALVDDPYPAQLRVGAQAIAAAADLSETAGWSLAWQSAGRSGGPWRGPDVAEVIQGLAEGEVVALFDRDGRQTRQPAGEVTAVVVCPHGFVSEHLETRYDLDLVARQAAEVAGMAFTRTEVVGADPTVFGQLADKILAVAGGALDPVLDVSDQPGPPAEP